MRKAIGQGGELMRAPVAAELRRCFKAFFAALHPDRFYGHPLAGDANVETLNLVNPLVNSFHELLESDRANLRFRPDIQRLRFYINSTPEPTLKTHSMPVNNLNITESRGSISWEELCFSLFTLLAKAGIEHDTCLSNAVLNRCLSEQGEHRPSEASVKGRTLADVLGIESWYPRIASKEDPLFGRLLSKNVRIQTDLSKEERKSALASLWQWRNDLVRLSLYNPNIILYIQSPPQDASKSPDMISLRPNFTIHDVLR